MFQNLNILVTRPDPQGSELVALINDRGGNALFLPTIAFAPPPNLSAFQAAMKEIGKQDWLIFISPRAVLSSVAAISAAWPQIPPQVKFAAVGEGTAEALQKAGYHVDAVPSDWGSEGLLALPVFQQAMQQKMAIIRGAEGRDIIEKTLISRGAQVLNVIAYQRVLPEVDMQTYLVKIKQNKIDMIICTSFEGVRNLKILFGKDAFPYLQVVPIIVVSERIKMLAHDLGFQTIWVAKNASHQAIIDSIATYLHDVRK